MINKPKKKTNEAEETNKEFHWPSGTYAIGW